MINSDFDTIIRNENNFQNRKKSKLKLFIIILIFIILIVSGVLGYFYYLKYKASIPKIKFFDYVDDSNISKIADTTLLDEITQKISDSSVSIQNELSFDGQDIISNLPILKLNYKKNSNNENIAELIFNKSEEDELIKFSVLFDNENIGIKSDDIVIKYVGSKIENLDELVLRINNIEDNINFSNQMPVEIPAQNMLEKYKNIINQRLTEDKFIIEENVLLTQNDISINTTLYELNLSKEDFLQILMELKNQFINDNELINCFITGTQTEETPIFNVLKLLGGYKLDIDIESTKEYVEEKFAELYNEISNLDNFYFKFDIYVSEENVVKKSINFGEYLEIEIENKEKSENENYAKITLLTKDEFDEKSGFSLSINRLNNNVSTIIDSELSIIENMSINNKLITNMTLEGNENSTSLNNKISFNFTNTDTQFSSVVQSKIEFGIDEEIEKLNNENCLFLDELDNNTLNQVIEQISNRIEEVNEQKQQEFLQQNLVTESEPFFDGFVNIDNQAQKNEKQKAQDKLVSAISEEMRIAENEDREYALANLQNLQIEGSTVSVIMGENMAIVAIDGYTFYIDPNFVLTTE